MMNNNIGGNGINNGIKNNVGNGIKNGIINNDINNLQSYNLHKHLIGHG